MLFPWFLIVIGAVFLLENLNLIPEMNWSIVWPVLLILAGLCMLKKRSGHECCSWFNKEKESDKK